MTTTAHDPAILSPETLLAHWEGHRGLTRRTIELFPEEHLFTFAPAPPMRSFGAMMLEVVGMVRPTLEGLQTGEWSTTLPDLGHVSDRAALLAAWDESDVFLRDAWARLSPERLAQSESVYGFPARPNVHLVLYLIDNEIHHRAQGFTYLRLLGVEPPSFYQR